MEAAVDDSYLKEYYQEESGDSEDEAKELFDWYVDEKQSNRVDDQCYFIV